MFEGLCGLNKTFSKERRVGVEEFKIFKLALWQLVFFFFKFLFVSLTVFIAGTMSLGTVL